MGEPNKAPGPPVYDEPCLDKNDTVEVSRLQVLHVRGFDEEENLVHGVRIDLAGFHKEGHNDGTSIWTWSHRRLTRALCRTEENFAKKAPRPLWPLGIESPDTGCLQYIKMEYVLGKKFKKLLVSWFHKALRPLPQFPKSPVTRPRHHQLPKLYFARPVLNLGIGPEA